MSIVRRHAARASMSAGVIFAFCATPSIALSTDDQLLQFHNGRACWTDFSCTVLSKEISNAELNSEPATNGSRKKPASSDKPKIIKTNTGAIGEPTKKQSVSAVAALGGPKFYRYPAMYRGETPPRMPPGAENHLLGNPQPYVQASQGIWYWPGADSVKFPLVAGFDPQIVAANVIEW